MSIHAVNGENPRGPGLFEVRTAGEDGKFAFITNVRRLAGRQRPPGSAVISAATWLLALLDAGLFYVSFDAQYKAIFAVKNASVPSMIEAAMLDAGMVILSALGIGLALAGKPSKTERLLIMVCSAASAGMNLAAANPGNWRSVAAYAAAPVFAAVVTDRVISVIRRHVLPGDSESAWAPLGRAVAAMARLAGIVALYLLRTALAPAQTLRGLRQMVLDTAPLPGVITVTAEPAPGDLVPCPVHGIAGCPYGWCMEKIGDGLPCARRHPGPEHDFGPPEYGFESLPEDSCAADSAPGQVCGHPLPCPEHPAIMPPEEKLPAFGSKREAFEWHYRRHPQFGDRQAMSQVAKEIGERAGLQWGTARTYAAAILAADAISDAMDAARECDEEER